MKIYCRVLNVFPTHKRIFKHVPIGHRYFTVQFKIEASQALNIRPIIKSIKYQSHIENPMIGGDSTHPSNLENSLKVGPKFGI